MLEIVTPGASGRAARVVLFDFDGTISTIRSGWMDVMAPMMVETLVDLKTGESEEELRAVVDEFIGRLTGKETIYQMIAFAEEIEKRGGTALDPLVYKKRYLDALWLRIEHRVKELEAGHCPPEKYMVPGSRELLEGLRARGLKLYLASGTDEIYMKREADLLDISKYFDGDVYGALDDYKSFSKAILIQRILASAAYTGEQFLGFGDGYVEIENVNKVGGVTVGVASAEPECQTVDEWKRKRLISVGANFIVPHYGNYDELFGTLFPNGTEAHA